MVAAGFPVTVHEICDGPLRRVEHCPYLLRAIVPCPSWVGIQDNKNSELGQMAGTFIVPVYTEYSHQRRFSIDEVEIAFSDAHLYLVSRAPVVRLVAAKWSRSELQVTFARAGDKARLERSLAWERPNKGWHVEISADGCYWRTVGAGSSRGLHGNSWSLLALSDPSSEIRRQDVLYVGQAYGKSGERSAYTRAEAHSTLQRIHEDHQASDWDIFFTPCLTEKFVLISTDLVDDMELGPDGAVLDRDGWSGNLSHWGVSLAEHCMIAHFRPPYNSMLLSLDHRSQAKYVVSLREARMRQIEFVLRSWNRLTMFGGVDSTGGSSPSPMDLHFGRFWLSDMDPDAEIDGHFQDLLDMQVAMSVGQMNSQPSFLVVPNELPKRFGPRAAERYEVFSRANRRYRKS